MRSNPAEAARDMLRDVLGDATHGVFPTDEALEALGLPGNVTEAIADAAAPIVALAAAGMRGKARQQQLESIADIVPLIPAGWRPQPLAADDDPRRLAAMVHGVSDDPDNPRVLAARVPRS